MNIYLPAYEEGELQIYVDAIKEARKAFAAADPGEMAKNSGASYQEGAFVFKAMGHLFSVEYPQGRVNFAGTRLEPDVLVQVVFVNYLARARGTPLTYDYISYRDLPGGEAFYDAFNRMAILPIAEVLKDDPGRLAEVAPYLGGEVIEDRTRGEVLFWFLPRVPLRYLAWGGDEEIAPRANILFDSSSKIYLHTEDLAGAGHYLTGYILNLLKRQDKNA